MSGGIFYRNTDCVNTLSTGIAMFEMKTTGHFYGSFTGGRAIHQKGIIARFVRLDFYGDFSVSEVEVYGKLGIYLPVFHINYSILNI